MLVTVPEAPELEVPLARSTSIEGLADVISELVPVGIVIIIIIIIMIMIMIVVEVWY